MAQRNGSLPYVEGEKVCKQNFYSSINRRVHPQPDAKCDMIYGDGNFISTIDQKDRIRAAANKV